MAKFEVKFKVWKVAEITRIVRIEEDEEEENEESEAVTKAENQIYDEESGNLDRRFYIDRMDMITCHRVPEGQP